MSARGRLGKSGAPAFFISGPPHIFKTDRARKLKFGLLAGICRYYCYIEKFDGYGVSGEISNAHFLFWDPLHISVTNGAGKLKFGTLVGIYA